MSTQLLAPRSNTLVPPLVPAASALVGAAAGTSFKPEHAEAILAGTDCTQWFEVHAENYMMEGGPRLHVLDRIRRDHPVSIHGVGMSIGGVHSIDRAHLQRFRTLIKRSEPVFVSEHLAWSTHGPTFYNDLLPLPYNEASLTYVCAHLDEVQECLGRTIMVENPSTYVAFSNSTMTETQFLKEMVRRTGCGLLLDINNVFVSATNHGYSPAEYLTDFPMDAVGELHLAAHSEKSDDEGARLLIHSSDRELA